MKVRIYKSPDGNGKYLNKTSQFLKKAQLGGVPAESEMGYPGSSSEKKEATQEELVELIANDLNNNIDEQTISYKLATFYDLEPMTALNLVSQVKEYIESQDVIDYDVYDEDEEEQTTDEEDAEEEDLLEAEAVLNGPGQDLDEASNEIANSESIATQDDGFEDDMFNQYQYQSNQDDGYSYGGLYKAEDGAETSEDGDEASEEMINPNGYVPNYPFDQTRHEITFPGIETYLPFNMSEFLDGTVDPATGNYINNLDESEEENVDEYESEYETEDAENNIPANGDYQEGQVIDPETDPSIIQMKKGGNYKRNKRAYVNSILKLAKKAEGGEEKKSDNDPEAGDPTGAKIRKQKLNNFIGSLKKETEMFTLREQAEKQYDQMMQQQQQQMPSQNQMMQNGGSREPRVVRGNELRYRANQLKDFITGQNRRNREDNIDYHNVNDYPTSNFEEGDYNKDGYTDAMDFASSPEQLKLRNKTCFEDENGQTNCFPRRNENSNDGSPKYGPDKDGYKFPNANQGHVTSSTVPKIGQTWDDWWVTSTGNTPGFVPDNRKWNGKDWVSRAEYYGNSDYCNNVSYDRKPSYTLDVRKSNWLTGRPSKYRIDFYGYSPLVDIANGNNPGVISNKPVVNSSKVSTIVSTVNKSQSTDLQNGYFKTDANGDKIPDYLQPGPLSGLPINGTSNLDVPVDVPVVVANTPEEIAKAKELESKKTKQLIDNKLAKEIAEAKRQVELQQQILEAQRQVRLEQQRLNEREQGGFVDSNNPDLYEFNYGGYDPTQQDIDYSNSIDTTDPYFQRGGGVRKFIENYFPGNILSPQRTYRNEIQRVYDPRTGKTVNMPIDMGRLSSVDVQKSRFWSGKPKKYTMYFNGSTSKPVLTSNNSSSQSGHDRFCEMFPDSPMCTGIKKRDAQWNTTDGLGLKSRMAIRKGERWNKRNSRRLERQGLDEYGNRPGDEQGAIYNGDGKLVRNAEGDYFDRYNEKIPDKKRPTDMENWWQNDRYFKQNTKNNEPMSNEELFKSQGKSFDPVSKKWLTADQRTAINMLNPKSPIKDESGNLKEQLQSNGIYNYKQYGGNLDMYLPKKTVGGPPPCGPGEMLDPATNKCKATPGSGVLKNNPPNGAPGSPGTIDSWGGKRAAMNPNIPFAANPGASMKQMMGLDTESMKSFTNPDGTPVGGNTDDPYSIDVKNKRTPLTFGKDNTAVSEARLNMFNAGVDIADSLKRGRESNKAENEMYENLSSNNLYASDPSRDRGDYDTNSGLYRPNEQGQMWNSRSAQYGGYIDEEEYYDPYTEEEDELTYANGGEKITYMSEDQIRAFMAEGGQVEFL